MRILEICEMQRGHMMPGISTMDIHSPKVKKAIANKAKRERAFGEMSDLQKFESILDSLGKTKNKISVILVDRDSGNMLEFNSSSIESINNGIITFVKKSKIAREIIKVSVNMNDVLYKGRLTNSVKSPYTYKFEIPFDANTIEREMNPDFMHLKK